MKLHVLLFLSALANLTQLCGQEPPEMKHIQKNGMSVSWTYVADRIFFEMKAPTKGWIAIGFNTQTGMTGAYLLMGHIMDDKAAVVEHYTSSPGHYQAISKYGIKTQVEDIEVLDVEGGTGLRFSLPLKAASTYQRDLLPTTSYTLIMAYSRADDFQHHSMMRTSVQIKL